jgi:hypothetical protein
MSFAPPPVPIPLPIHVVDPPGMAGWLIAVISGAVGFILAVAAEPLKAHVMEMVVARKVKPILYRELATWLADLEAGNHSEDKTRFHYAIHNKRRFTSMEWFSEHQFNVVLRADPSGALGRAERVVDNLCREMLAKYDEETTGMMLCEVVPELVKSMASLGVLDVKSLDKATADEKAERERRKKILEKISAGIFPA